MKLNENYNALDKNYLFFEVAKRVKAYQTSHPASDVIRLGIGDVTLPLPTAVVNAMHLAVSEEGKKETFRGYCDEQGYIFLREAIVKYYSEKNVELNVEEVFISDGAKSDLGNILDLFDINNTVLIPNPVYPAYVDVNVMDGRKVLYMDGTEENGFCPLPSNKEKADIIYVCSPNNPTGATYPRNKLKKIVLYAIQHDAIIIFDAAYEAFISGDYPKSIYEIEGAKRCAVEISSFSKTAGFTGTRCGYCVVPLEIMNGKLNKMWLRRQTTKFNGVAYVVQRGAEAVFSENGRKEIEENIRYYKRNATLITNTLSTCDITFTGGENSPYVWLKCPKGFSSWQFFDYLLQNAGVIGTPGCGFGKNGEGWFRLTAFNSAERTAEAMERIKRLLIKN